MQFLDLVVLAEYMQGWLKKIPNITIWGIIKGRASSAEIDRIGTMPIDCFCADIEVWGCRLDRGAMRSSATPPGIKLIARTEEYHLLKGNIKAVIPKAWMGRNEPIEIYGNMYRIKNMNASFYMANWTSHKKKFSLVGCTTRDIDWCTLPTNRNGENLVIAFKNSIKGESIEHGIKVPNSLMILGVEVDRIRKPKIDITTHVEGNKNLGKLFINSEDNFGLPYAQSNTRDLMLECMDISNNSRGHRIRTYAKTESLGRSKELDKLYEYAKVTLEKREKYVESVRESLDNVDEEAYIQRLGNNIERSWSRGRISNKVKKGKDIFTEALADISLIDKSKVAIMVKKYGKDMLYSWVNNCTDNIFDDNVLRVTRAYLIEARKEFYFYLISNIINLEVSNEDIDLWDIKEAFSIKEFVMNPYIMGVRSTIFSTKDIDTMAMVFDNITQCAEDRSILCLEKRLITEDNTKGSTVLKRGVAENLNLDYFEIDCKSSMLTEQHEYSAVGSKLEASIKEYINEGFCAEYLSSVKVDIGRKIGNEIRVGMGYDKRSMISRYIKNGFGLVFNHKGIEYITSTSTLYKELFIYDSIHSMLEKSKGNIDRRNIDRYIKEFEDYKSASMGVTFRLEKEQRNLGYLINNNVLAIIGKAGSGKTTALEYIVYCLRREHKFLDEDFVLVAPSGIASQRLAESTQMKAGTIHSKFSISVNGVSHNNDSIGGSVIIVDEASMINTEIMYNLMKKVGNDNKIIFVGDIAQLKPIGCGIPFIDILRDVPCAELKISKRASECSDITKLADNLFKRGNIEIPHGKDVIVRSVLEESECKNEVLKIIEESHVGIQDIQVISPVRKSTFEFGTAKLNTAIQGITNMNKKKLVCMSGYDENNMCEFIVGDKVVNTKNMKHMPKYILCDNTYVKVDEGVFNGTRGVIKDIVRETDINIEGVNVSEKSENIGLIIVEVQDFENGTVYIMYEFNIVSINNNVFKKMFGVKNLELAYALTTHKMQGSEAKVVIAVLYRCGGRGFIDRNMVYTMITRASEKLYIVGDSSVINYAKNMDSISGIETAVGLYHEA